MDKKRVDVEISLFNLAYASSEATKLGISRRQYMTRLMEKVLGTLQQSPNLPIKDIVSWEFTSSKEYKTE